MTPTDIKEALQKEANVFVNVFVNYDDEYACYLVLTDAGAKHYMNVPLTSEYDWLLEQNVRSLGDEIYRANKIIETQRKMDEAFKALTAFSKTNDTALKIAKEALNA